MLLLFNKSESLECAKVVVLKLGAILFYSGIHFKPLKSWKKISRRSEQAHSTKGKQIHFVGTCRKVPLVIISIIAVEKWSLWLRSVPSVGNVGYLVLGDRFDQRICALTDRPGPSYKKTEILLPQIDTQKRFQVVFVTYLTWKSFFIEGVLRSAIISTAKVNMKLEQFKRFVPQWTLSQWSSIGISNFKFWWMSSILKRSSYKAPCVVESDF